MRKFTWTGFSFAAIFLATLALLNVSSRIIADPPGTAECTNGCMMRDKWGTGPGGMLNAYTKKA